LNIVGKSTIQLIKQMKLKRSTVVALESCDY
jgi:hypothetical protein